MPVTQIKIIMTLRQCDTELEAAPALRSENNLSGGIQLADAQRPQVQFVGHELKEQCAAHDHQIARHDREIKATAVSCMPRVT